MEGEEHKSDTQVVPERVTDTTATSAKKQPWALYGIAVIVVAAILAGVVYMMEQQGRLSTGLFGTDSSLSAKKTVAVVNGTEIKGADLTTSINQIAATAQQQGVDVTSPTVQADIQAQAVEMLVNTELLKQEAAERGIVITDEQVDARLDLLVQEIGSEEALAERMETLGIDNPTLRRDIKSELVIQALLDQVFAAEVIEVTEEEVVALYEGAGGAEAGLPALEEVRPQVEAQIKATKEQAIIDALIQELRTDAAIEIKG